MSAADIMALVKDERPERAGAMIGLTETVAWIVSRDEALGQAVRTFQAQHGSDAIGSGFAWEAVLASAGTSANYRDLEGELFDAVIDRKLVATGRLGEGAFEEIDPHQWIGAQVLFIDDRDALAPAGSELGIAGPVWSGVQFSRARVMEIWPPKPAVALSAPVTPPRQRRERTKLQVGLFAFYALADKDGLLPLADGRTYMDLYRGDNMYLSQCEKRKWPKAKFSTFKKWALRYEQGER